MASFSHKRNFLCSKYWRRIETIVVSGKWADCNFLVGVEPNQKSIAGYKNILAMASPVFEAMFYGEMSEQNQIFVPDIEAETFQTLIVYVITQNVEIYSYSLESSWKLFYCAKKYMLPVLEKKCSDYIFTKLSPQNVCKQYESADLLGDQIIMDRCLEIISISTNEILSQSSFIDIEIETVATVFKQQNLSIENELDLYNAAVRYVRVHRFPGNRGKPPSPTTLTPAIPADDSCAAKKLKLINNIHITFSLNKCKHDPDIDQMSIRRAIQEIRFLTLTEKEFATAIKTYSLLTEDEQSSILMKIVFPSCGTPMPNGFSTSRDKRCSIAKPCPNCNKYCYFYTVDVNRYVRCSKCRQRCELIVDAIKK